MYPFVWLPAKIISHTQYNVLYALQAGISIVIGGYAIGWLSDNIGRRKALILSATFHPVLGAPRPEGAAVRQAPARPCAGRTGPLILG